MRPLAPATAKAKKSTAQKGLPVACGRPFVAAPLYRKQ